jgi:3-methyladenine DNA glycosylase AlkD
MSVKFRKLLIVSGLSGIIAPRIGVFGTYDIKIEDDVNNWHSIDRTYGPFGIYDIVKINKFNELTKEWDLKEEVMSFRPIAVFHWISPIKNENDVPFSITTSKYDLFKKCCYKGYNESKK